MAGSACIPQTIKLYSYRANAFHQEVTKMNRDGAQRMALCSMHVAMRFSTKSIHLKKSLHYLISFLFHIIPKGNHLPIYIRKLTQQVHRHIRYDIV